MIIYPTGGLSNKLRVLFSYYQYTSKINKILYVIWDITEECPGFFLNYFLPINNIKIIECYKHNKNDINRIKPDYKGSHWHPTYSPYENDIYGSLHLHKHMKDIIENNIKKLGNRYISVHIRRTDHIYLAKKNNNYSKDIEFVNFINKYDDYNLYIATDNKETQDIFYKLYKNRIKVIKFIDDKYKCRRRKTNLGDSIIDLYMCIHSEHFMGSGFSSYSHLIEHFRKKIENRKNRK